MIAIALDDSACVAVGNKGCYTVSSDILWTGAGWLVAEAGDAASMIEAHHSADLGELVGLRGAMALNGSQQPYSRLDYLAALFQHCADALREDGEEDLSAAVIAIPAAASYWATGPLGATGAGHAALFDPQDVTVRRDFERAAHIAGFSHVRVQPTALMMFEANAHDAAMPAIPVAGIRSAIVEVFRSGFSITPVTREGDNPASIVGQQLFFDYDVERLIVTIGASEKEQPLLPRTMLTLARNALLRDDARPANALRDGSAKLVDVRSDAFDAARRTSLDARTKLKPDEIQNLLRHPRHDKKFFPEYVAVFVTGWLTQNAALREMFMNFGVSTLTRGVRTPSASRVSLVDIAETARALAGNTPIGPASAEHVHVERIVPPTSRTPATSIEVSGDHRPTINRLPWLIEGEASPSARLTIGRGEASRPYKVVFSPEPWELHARAEVEVAIEHDDRVRVTTLIDGRPAPADVRDEADGQELEAIAPGRFELYLGPEHRLLTEISRKFKKGPHSVIARFRAEAGS